MVIQVTCDSCYRQYRVKDHLGGKVLPCKDCGAKFRVPRRGDSVDDPYEESDRYQGDRSRSPRRRKARSRKQSPNFVPWIVVVGIGLLAPGGMFVWKAIDNDSNPPAVVTVRTVDTTADQSCSDCNHEMACGIPSSIIDW